jgi:hypothetical protein
MRVPGSGVSTAGPGSLRSLLVPLVVLIPVVLLFAGTSGSGREFPIVFTQLPADAARSASDAPLFDCGEGARIVRLPPRGKKRVLTRKFAGACDPEISFDGTRMLFAGKRAAADPWNVFEMDLETGEVRQITRDHGNCRSPTYQGRLFTLDSPEPWSQITFVSDLAGEINEHGVSPATSLYTVRLDGSGVQRLTYNPSSDVDPTVLPDGRLLFASWQRATLDRGATGRVALFTSQIDGIDYALFSGDEGRRVKTMPCVTKDRLVVFVETDDPVWDGSGTLGSVSLRRNLHSYEPVTTATDGRFHSPSPLPAGKILVSRRPDSDEGTHGLYTLDPVSGEIDAVFDDPDHHDVQAVAVIARPRPDGRSTVLSEEFSTGVLYGLDVYDSDLGALWVSTRTPLRLRVLEGIPRREASRADEPAVLHKRFLGEVDVEKDGSFNVEVPANTPIRLQLVDEDGLALRSCSWIWVRNRETRGCIGCHEDGERAPENRFVEALAKPSIPLDLPPERRRTVDFRRDVLPILSSRCASAACHGGGRVEPVLDGVASDGDVGDLAYEELLAGFPFGGHDEGPARGKYVQPGRARTSPLIWHVYGANTARPWDEGPRTIPAPMPFAGIGLTDDEKRVLAEWIDLGAPRGAPAATEPREGGAR